MLSQECMQSFPGDRLVHIDAATGTDVCIIFRRAKRQLSKERTASAQQFAMYAPPAQSTPMAPVSTLTASSAPASASPSRSAS